VQFAVLPECD